MQNKETPQYGEYISCDRLENASQKLHLDLAQPENEVRLINLHNHLVWHSYTPGKDGIADAIFCAAIRDVMEEYNLGKADIPIIFLVYMESIERRQL